ncbi:hypothetical protein [Streptomyces sp. 6N223]|uniref:hypothetical protein n=1 Tax=Streptomyces sp. 6N223 TaxID=3457412 RepID=UPI003FD450FF
MDGEGEAMTARMVRWHRTRRGGARCLLRAVVIVFAALVVLVHHQIAGVANAAPAPSAAPAAHAVAHIPGMAMPAGSAALPAEHAAPGPDVARPAESWWDAPAHGPCPSVGMQHCAPAGVDAVQLAPPPSSPAERAPDSCAAVSHRLAAAVPQHAPPDLNVLSRLLI